MSKTLKFGGMKKTVPAAGRLEVLSKAHAPHQTQRIPLKMIEVDTKIVPLVNWLNHFKGVTTEWSCQGNEHTCNGWNKVGTPYVVFYCVDSLSLIRILHDVKRLGDMTVDFYEGSLRYELRFATIEDLDFFLRLIRRKEDKEK